MCPKHKGIEQRLLVVCLILATGKEAFGQTRPSNAVTESGGEVIFNCSTTTLRPNWFTSRDGSANQLATIVASCVVTSGLENHYRTDPTGGLTACNLIVFNVTMEQAGVYWCSDGVASFYALLTVIDPSPVITDNCSTAAVEGESVMFECVLNYNGSIGPANTLRPHFYWTNSNGQNVTSSSNSTTNDRAVSRFAVAAQRGNNITAYTCHVYVILNPSTTANYDNNTPTVNCSATSRTIEVLYVPYTPVITSRAEVIAINGVSCGISVLKCSSSGNPVPSYKWFDSVQTVLSTTDTLDLAEINRSYKCEAYNTIRNVIYEASVEHTVTKGNCFSAVDCCVFPRNDTTTVNGTQCPNGTAQCDCSQGDSGITLFCYATAYPNPLYMWNGPGVLFGPSDSSVFDKVSANGTYTCTAYFDRTSSNYTGGVSFSNGIDSTTVHECSRQATKTMVNSSTSAATSTTINEQTTATVFQSPSENSCGAATGPANVAAIALGVLLFISLTVNIIQMVVLIWNRRAKRDPFKRTGNILQPDMPDLSPETQTPTVTAYEELSRPAEINLQLVTYEELRHKPATNTNQRY